MTEFAYTYTYPYNTDNVLEVVAREHLHITVSEEQAVDSYNDTFSTSITLSREDAANLVSCLVAWLGQAS